MNCRSTRPSVTVPSQPGDDPDLYEGPTVPKCIVMTMLQQLGDQYREYISWISTFLPYMYSSLLQKPYT